MQRDVSGERLHYLDGIRGWGAVMVFYFHLVTLFLGEGFKQFSYLFNTLFFDGHLAVLIFFVVSGASLSIGPIRKGTDAIITAILSRYLRLMIPVLVTILFGFVIFRNGWMFNDNVAFPGEDKTWINQFYSFWPSLRGAVSFAVYDVFFNYKFERAYNFALWTMQYEIMGSFAIYLFLLTVRSSFFRLLFATGLTVVLLVKSPFMACFFAGFLLANAISVSGTKRSLFVSWLAFFLFACGVASAAFYRPGNETYWALVAIAITAGCIYCSPINSFMGNRFSQFLGKISFPLYLTHVPVICSLSSWLYIALPDQGYSHIEAFWINVGASSLASFLVALLFIPTETFAIYFSRGFGKAMAAADMEKKSTGRLFPLQKLLSYFSVKF